MKANVAALAGAAARRRERAERAVREALDAARTAGTPVTIAGIAASAGVSADFIYRHPEIRPEAEALRRAGRTAPAGGDTSDASGGSLVRRLSQELTEIRRKHREEVTELRRALEAAHGELLALRRRLGRD